MGPAKIFSLLANFTGLGIFLVGIIMGLGIFIGVGFLHISAGAKMVTVQADLGDDETIKR